MCQSMMGLGLNGQPNQTCPCWVLLHEKVQEKTTRSQASGYIISLAWFYPFSGLSFSREMEGFFIHLRILSFVDSSLWILIKGPLNNHQNVSYSQIPSLPMLMLLSHDLMNYVFILKNKMKKSMDSDHA